MRTLLGLIAVSLLLIQGCDQVTGPVDLAPSMAVLDGTHDGNSHFYFLPPIVKNVSHAGEFDPTLSPQIEVTEDGEPIANLSAVLVVATADGTSADSMYQAHWHTKDAGLDPSLPYRLNVRVDGFLLGFVDLDVVSGGKDLKNARTGDVIALKDGGNLVINLRIERGALPPLDGLVGFYPFAGDATDYSGNGAHGTVVGPTLAVDRFGRVEQAYEFDGTGFIGMGDRLNLGPQGTVSLWVKPGDLSRPWSALVTKGGSSTPGPDLAYAVYHTNAGSLYGDVGTGTGTRQSPYLATESGTVSQGVWQHVVYRFGGGHHALFVNGMLLREELLTITPGDNPNPFYLGRWSRFDSQTHDAFDFVGLMDDVAIYSRPLSQAEILELCEAGGWTGCGAQPPQGSPWQGLTQTTSGNDVFAVTTDGDVYEMNYDFAFGADRIDVPKAEVVELTKNDLTGELLALTGDGCVYSWVDGQYSAPWQLRFTLPAGSWTGLTQTPNGNDVFAVTADGDVYEMNYNFAFGADRIDVPETDVVELTKNDLTGELLVLTASGRVYSWVDGQYATPWQLRFTLPAGTWRGLTQTPNGNDVFAATADGDVYEMNYNFAFGADRIDVSESDVVELTKNEATGELLVLTASGRVYSWVDGQYSMPWQLRFSLP